MVDTVKFNVGGRHFEVSRDLIEQNPDTILAKMISETWDNDRGKAIFIDRDGDLFAQVLNYLRYGSIELPVSIPKAMFHRELDYYSITGSKRSVTQERRKTIAEMTEEINGDLRRLRHHELRRKIWQLANEMYRQFHECNLKEGQVFVHGYFSDRDLPDGMTIAQMKDTKSMLKMFLNNFFGLQISFKPRGYDLFVLK